MAAEERAEAAAEGEKSEADRLKREMDRRIRDAGDEARRESEDRIRRLADRVAKEAEARARAEAEATLSQEAVKLQREADERVEAARRRAEQEVQEKVERARTEALTGAVPDEAGESDGEPGEAAVQPISDGAPAGEPAGTRYVGGRRLRTY
jgi:hypothetical protein